MALIPQLQALAAVAGHPDMQQVADNPKVSAKQVLEVLTGVADVPLDTKVSNLVRTVVENGRLAALPEIAAQFNALVKSRSRVRRTRPSKAPSRSKPANCRKWWRRSRSASAASSTHRWW